MLIATLFAIFHQLGNEYIKCEIPTQWTISQQQEIRYVFCMIWMNIESILLHKMPLIVQFHFCDIQKKTAHSIEKDAQLPNAGKIEMKWIGYHGMTANKPFNNGIILNIQKSRTCTLGACKL